MAPTDPERIATLEAVLPRLEAKVDKLGANVETLLATHNQHKGMARLGLLVWTTIAGVIGGCITMLLGRHL
jgi:hypothetical protein